MGHICDEAVTNSLWLSDKNVTQLRPAEFFSALTGTKLTQMKNKLIQAIGAGFAATTVGALAGDFTDTTTAVVDQPSGGSGNWCEAIGDIGTVYKDKSNPWIQEVKFFGRAHQQWGYTDGSDNGRDFSGDGDELRRLRAGTSIKFLNGFTLLGRVDLEDGGFRDTNLDYGGFDELYLNYNFGDLGSLSDFTVGYGRYKLGFGGEEVESSKKIKTIERSLLNNYYVNGRPTGARVSFTAGDINYLFGVYAVDGDNEALSGFSGDMAYHLGAEFAALGGDVFLQAVINDSDGTSPDDVIGFDWAVSANYTTEIGRFDLFTNATYGEGYDGNAVYGVVIMPSTMLIEDKLEAVFRYQWAHSEGDGYLRPQSRNVRNVAGMDGVGLLGGDDNHNFYAGLNYFICEHHAKAMLGVEHEINDGGTADTEATTLWGALRFYF